MLKVAIIQAPLAWENATQNAQYFYNALSNIEQVDLVVLPEMFSTGFTMNPEANFEFFDGELIENLIQISSQKNIAITGSLIIKEDDKYYNRLIFITPDKKMVKYDKRHLFSLANEEKYYTAGKDRLLVEYKGWKICPLVCYDLRFPVFSRNDVDYDLLIYVASWPEKRIYAWDSLLKARAIENMAYTIGVNRIGVDGYNANYVGHSQVLDYMGQYLIEPFEDEAIKYVELDKEIKNKAVSKLGFLSDRDQFLIK
nr:nitrilase family protein [uncultured Flavobacterium sp.]